LWLLLGVVAGIKRVQYDSVFFGVLVLRFFWADFLVKTTRFFSEGEEIAQIETECRNWDSYFLSNLCWQNKFAPREAG
jgi:hypothetical protein